MVDVGQGLVAGLGGGLLLAVTVQHTRHHGQRLPGRGGGSGLGAGSGDAVVSGVCHELRPMPADRPAALVPHSNVGLFIPVISSGPPTSYAARGGWGR